MSIRKSITPIIMLFTLAGCCSPHPIGSWVGGGVSSADKKMIGNDVGDYVASQLPSVKSEIWVEPIGKGKRGPLIDEVEDTLRQRGYPVLPDSAPRPATAHLVRVIVSGHHEWGEANAFIYIDGRESSREYARDAIGALRPAGPFSVKE